MFLDSLDIANRVCQHLGVPPILDINEDSQKNTEIANAYDKLRATELRRNVWRFATRKVALRPVDTTTMILVPAAWNAATTYLPGSIVSDSNGQLWLSNSEENINNAPGQTAFWETYFGPLTVSAYDSTQAYAAGELVYKPGAVAGSYGVFMSLQGANSAVPDVATAWDATVTYFTDQVVSYLGSNWRSLIPVNLNNTPANGPLAFDVGATYTIGQTVTGSDHYIYSSVGNGNIGHEPTTDGGVHWTNTNVPNAWSSTALSNPILAASATSWRAIGATVRHLSFVYPIGSGPSSQSSTRNVYRLPSGFLREAPQDPKAGSTSALGAPSGLAYNDWEYEGNFIVTSQSSAFIYRFVADIYDVQKMDPMFCEGLACRIAEATCEIITSSTAKLTALSGLYKTFMGEARTVNSVETGPVEPPEDDFISCRA